MTQVNRNKHEESRAKSHHALMGGEKAEQRAYRVQNFFLHSSTAPKVRMSGRTGV